MKNTVTQKKTIPRYETRHFDGVVYLREEILPSGAKILVKDIKYLHPQYRQHEIDHYVVGEKILTKVTNLKRKRSLEQNRYMHMYFTLIAMAHGHNVTMEDVKNWAKGKHLSKGITEIYGSKVRKVKGTSDLTVGEMIEFLARVECDTNIPMPDASPFQFALTKSEFEELKQAEKARYLAMKPTLEGI